MANVNSHWKRFLAISCSHGHLADPAALKAVLKFKKAWKPHRTIHLGDYTDMTAFRKGARGTKDEAESIAPDLRAGVRFIEQLEPTDLFNGNHDIRVWEALSDRNAITAHAAGAIVNEVLALRDQMKFNFIEHYDIDKSWIQISDTKFLHGFMYNQMAIRDHAEHFGKCILAHLHRVGEEPGRRADHPVGYCVGYLGKRELFSYAETRRATAAWSQGLAQFEYNDKECRIWLRKLDSLHLGL